ncbi:hypothetical protein FRC17_007963 [Serendipita sp. 399]|nr:hypothetical protein FRC17_007963 [Serendipita sp. 399]
MSKIFRRNSSLGPGLPFFFPNNTPANATNNNNNNNSTNTTTTGNNNNNNNNSQNENGGVAGPSAASPERQLSTDQVTTVDASEKRNPRRTFSIPRVLRLDTSFTSRHHGLVVSPDGSPTQEGDGTFSQMILEGMNEKDKAKLTGKTMVEEEKPGSGHVWDVWPILPRNVRRWDKPAHHVTIPAGSVIVNRQLDPLPEGWTMYIHPEGKPFYHRIAMEPEYNLLQGTLLFDKGKPLCRPLEIVTDSDPRDPVTRKTLEHAHFIARVTVAENNFELPERSELFIELYPENEPDLRPYAGYYLADHTNQTIFWAAPVKTDDLGALRVNPGTFGDQHLKCFPLDKNIDIKAAHENLVDQLSFMYIDIATSVTSTSTWSENECQSFLSILNHCPERRKTWTIARLTALMAQWQFQNLYGHPAARLDRTYSYEVEVDQVDAEDKDELDAGDQASNKSGATATTKASNYRWKAIKSRMEIYWQIFVAVLLRITCTLLFDAPAAHNTALEKVWVDKIVHRVRFQDLIDKTVKEWSDVSLLSTVLWTANMAFLAIPYPILDPQQQNPLSRFQTVTRIAMITASLGSTVFSVGSIAISLLHIRKHRTERTAEESCNFLETQHHHVYGHRPLAILWALPFAFLMWSVLSFSAAVMLFCVTASGIVTEVTTLGLSAVIVGWIVLSVWYFWRREANWTPTANGRRSFRMIFTDWLWEMKLGAEKFGKSFS